LVDRPITVKGGALGFVDDYTAWVVGPSISHNVDRLQQEVMPQAEQWAESSGATFDGGKTHLIYFTRLDRTRDAPPEDLQFKGRELKAEKEVKILGVLLDEKLKMNAYVA
ncbi:uncharacterized protein K452DRAFT_212534, partial [Aplosporella prunicola CBS 121167]